MSQLAKSLLNTRKEEKRKKGGSLQSENPKDPGPEGENCEAQDYNQLTVVSFAAVVWSRDTTPSISRLRESTSRDETK